MNSSSILQAGSLTYWPSEPSTADSDEAAPLFRDDCAPGFRDDLAPCWWGLQAIIVVSSFRRGVKLFAVGFGADCRRSIRHGGHCGRGDPRWHRRKSGLL
ncbi:hypothetical protein CN116_24830 [Sinorhizobium meliloti]|nr:hypothetical protein CN240_01900 [Sinorhizobium meliloti]RVG49061.1 hypothetical protein CN227_03695 [Sinorhizobium meliloti]RVM58148.1 hypothetical protein CN124_28880 [Sinorhizobium meliloti]RVN21887.1 hypothetical protein CN116_24830 [Sinorhizobium meliloti]